MQPVCDRRMAGNPVRILLTADTHLGFDLPFRPRVQRRRRGDDFFASFELALQPAFRGEVDLVVHGGDLLYRSRVPAPLVEMALAPLVRVAEQGVPVYLVPGNHERSRIPLHLWARHPNLHIFRQPQTFVCARGGVSIALAGFPFARGVRDSWTSLVERTLWQEASADVRLLCIHQVVEGARIGPVGYTFRGGADVVRGRDIPAGLAAILAGHIHRAQVLTRDLGGRQLAAPVIYPGSIERTAFAERNEPKGYMLVRLEGASQDRRVSVRAEFVPLPARPMVVLRLEPGADGLPALAELVRSKLAALDPNSVVRLELPGSLAASARAMLGAAALRDLAPSSMNVELAPPS